MAGESGFLGKSAAKSEELGHLTQLHFCQCVEINQISLFFPINQHLICSRPSILQIHPLVQGVMDKTPEANTSPSKPSSQLPPSMSAAASVQCGVSNTYVEFPLWVTQVSSVQCDVSNAYVEWIVSVSNTLPISSHCPQDQLLTPNPNCSQFINSGQLVRTTSTTTHHGAATHTAKLRPIYKQKGSWCVNFVITQWP